MLIPNEGTLFTFLSLCSTVLLTVLVLGTEQVEAARGRNRHRSGLAAAASSELRQAHLHQQQAHHGASVLGHIAKNLTHVDSKENEVIVKKGWFIGNVVLPVVFFFKSMFNVSGACIRLLLFTNNTKRDMYVCMYTIYTE